MADENTTTLTDSESQEPEDPVKDQIPPGLLELLKGLSPREIWIVPSLSQVRSVGWGWWDALQGLEPEPDEEPDFDLTQLLRKDSQ